MCFMCSCWLPDKVTRKEKWPPALLESVFWSEWFHTSLFGWPLWHWSQCYGMVCVGWCNRNNCHLCTYPQTHEQWGVCLPKSVYSQRVSIFWAEKIFFRSWGGGHRHWESALIRNKGTKLELLCMYQTYRPSSIITFTQTTPALRMYLTAMGMRKSPLLSELREFID